MKVTDTMVDKAWRAFYEREGSPENDEREMMRNALTAAIGAGGQAVAEPVAYLTESYGYKRVFLEREAAEKLARGGDGEVIPLFTHPPQSAERVVEALEAYFTRQIEWSRKTFGPGKRTKGILDHISKELIEIADKPGDLSEWIDVVILAMDGFWRHGGTAADLMPRLLAKQHKNMARTWPDWRTMSEEQAIEHDRSGESALAQEGWKNG